MCRLLIDATKKWDPVLAFCKGGYDAAESEMPFALTLPRANIASNPDRYRFVVPTLAKNARVGHPSVVVNSPKKRVGHPPEHIIIDTERRTVSQNVEELLRALPK